MIKKIKDYITNVNFITLVTLISVYIIPTTIVKHSYATQKMFFLGLMAIHYLLSFLDNKERKKSHFIFLIVLAFLMLFSRNINFLTFFPLIMMEEYIANKDEIKKYISKSNILYFCLLATLFYSILYFGNDGRYAYTAVAEKNQSGLAIFCLSMLFMIKNKKVGYFTLFLGLLTFSRSYYLSLALFLISNIKYVKNFLYNHRKYINFFRYSIITFISTLVLFALGGIYIIQYYNGNILSDSEITNRLLQFFDYSNFYRFAVVVVLFILLYRYPLKLLFGMSDEFYIDKGQLVSYELDIPHRDIVPHNLFLSHLKIYGIFAVFEIIYVSKKIMKTVNYNNFLLYLVIILYSILLGAGLYSFWLFLSIIVLVSHYDGGDIYER